MVIDLERKKYSAAELAALASGLKYQATLTIVMAGTRKLTTAECVMIASKRPGQVIFQF